MLDTFFKLYQRVWIARIRDIQDFINSNDYYEGNGLKDQLSDDSNDSFKKFYVFDFLGRISEDKKSEYKKKREKLTNFWKAFLVRNIWVVYYGLICTGGYIGGYLLCTKLNEMVSFLIIFPSICVPIGMIGYLRLGQKDFHF